MIPTGIVIALALLGGLFIGYQIGATVGWQSGFRRRGALADEFEPTLLALERHVGWMRGRCGWAHPDHETEAQDKPQVLS